MEVEVGNARTLHSVVKSTSYTEWSGACAIREDQRSIESSDFGMLGKGSQTISGERHRASLAVLGLTKG